VVRSTWLMLMASSSYLSGIRGSAGALDASGGTSKV
jgi:hypothetical protein